MCPLRCGWYYDKPPIVVKSWSVETLLAAHISAHTQFEFMSALERLHAEILELTTIPEDDD
jgi:hypothetical protein